ncbi:hypothetical protein SeMB42_g06019 [Synchytrium endobioticum]|uniref:Uncharacterized protein n=1 Tax=Synchytrium endobioticum TaxID=286115 RepID=A0A507CKV0_9FUNG|nr:hypothetical protein SeMB42_g06019 [Synchytrium endobioticum]
MSSPCHFVLCARQRDSDDGGGGACKYSGRSLLFTYSITTFTIFSPAISSLRPHIGHFFDVKYSSTPKIRRPGNYDMPFSHPTPF